MNLGKSAPHMYYLSRGSMVKTLKSFSLQTLMVFKLIDSGHIFWNIYCTTLGINEGNILLNALAKFQLNG